MSEEPGHKAMLYFLEVLMNSNGALTISQLAGRFGSRNFTAEMRTACGGNESGLKKFLLKYPSLFTVRGNMVSLYDGKGGGDEEKAREGSPASSTSSGRGLPDVSIEMDAVQFFQGKLAKKEERWVPIKSLAGHISQASADVRNAVGPQLEFRKWLLRHPHIFEVQGELVGLRDGIAAVATPAIPNRRSGAFELANGGIPGVGSSSPALIKHVMIAPPRTPPAPRRVPPKTPPSLRRSHSFSEKRALQQQAQAQQTFSKYSHHDTEQNIQQPQPQPLGQEPMLRRKGNTPVTMTANEYKAVMYLKDILEKRGGVKLHNITGHFSQASEGVRNTIGWSKPQLHEFLSKHAGVFSVTEDEMVVLNKNAKLNVVITGSKPGPVQAGTRTLTGRKGKIFHVAKLWGIVDLGKHEHVFFDKSIMRRGIDDLQKEYKCGETLSFNAVLAPKTSRAKWKATQVWKEHESEPSDNDSELSSDGRPGMLSPSMSIEEEINQFLPNNDQQGEAGSKSTTFTDAAPSGAGVVPIWNFDETSAKGGSQEEEASLSMVPESYQMSASALSDIPNAVPKAPVNHSSSTGYNGVSAEVKAGGDTSNKVRFADQASAAPAVGSKKMVSIACQTIATGDIIATQLYQES